LLFREDPILPFPPPPPQPLFCFIFSPVRAPTFSFDPCLDSPLFVGAPHVFIALVYPFSRSLPVFLPPGIALFLFRPFFQTVSLQLILHPKPCRSRVSCDSPLPPPLSACPQDHSRVKSLDVTPRSFSTTSLLGPFLLPSHTKKRQENPFFLVSTNFPTHSAEPLSAILLAFIVSHSLSFLPLIFFLFLSFLEFL